MKNCYCVFLLFQAFKQQHDMMKVLPWIWFDFESEEFKGSKGHSSS